MYNHYFERYDNKKILKLVQDEMPELWILLLGDCLPNRYISINKNTETKISDIVRRISISTYLWPFITGIV